MGVLFFDLQYSPNLKKPSHIEEQAMYVSYEKYNVKLNHNTYGTIELYLAKLKWPSYYI